MKRASRPLVMKVALIIGAPFLAFSAAALVFITEWSRASFLQDVRSIGEEGEDEMKVGAGELLDSSDALLKGAVERITSANSADLSVIPFQLWGVEPSIEADIKEEIRLHGESLRERSLSNAGAISREFRRRADARLKNRLSAMRLRQDHAARVFASRLQTRTVGFLAASIILLAGALWATLWFTVLSPVGEIRRGAEKIGGGNLAHRISWNSADELGALARSFNSMGASLSATLDQLSWKQAQLTEANHEIRALNAGLEERVAAQTGEIRESLDALKRTQAELVHAAKMAGLGTLAGGIAHEFNNMIGGIRGCAEDALEEEDASEVRAALQMIVKTSSRACAVIENLLKFSRKSPPSFRPVSLASVAADTARLLESETARAGVSVRLALDETAVVEGDQAQLHQVALNLMTNALHAVEGRERKEIEVSVSAGGGSALLEVSDTGPGVPPEISSKVFEPFFTTKDGSGAGARVGTGLGLSVSYGIIESHRGSIEVGVSEMKGARFTVRLPICEAARGAAGARHD